jgi:hypothetical protein
LYRIDANSGELQQVLTDVQGPNGLAFSPDESVLYVVESRAQPHRKVWAYNVEAKGQLSNKRLVIDAQGPGALDGIAIDRDGNIWCGWGSDGSVNAKPSGTLICQSVAPTCVLAALKTTDCSWPVATRCTPSTQTRVVLFNAAHFLHSVFIQECFDEKTSLSFGLYHQCFCSQCCACMA